MRLTGIREASRLVLESGALAGRVAGRLEERRVRDTVTTHSQRDYGGPSWLPAPGACRRAREKLQSRVMKGHHHWIRQ